MPATPQPSARLPLAGIRVVEFGQFIAVPGTSMLLADMGAEVIKVESLAGDAARQSSTMGVQSPMYVAYNRRKRSIALDLRSAGGRAVARELALSADVVVQNARAGVMERLGLGPDVLRQAKPALIYASVTGFGTRGPSRERPGLDIAAQAESGMMSLTGEPGGAPLKVGFAVVDAATTLALSGAITAALFHRERTGEGQTIDTSLLEVAVHLQAQIWSEYHHSGKLPPRAGNSQPMAAPAADLVQVADGHIVISAYLQEHWRRLCQAIGRPDLADDARFVDNVSRLANRPALIAELHASLGGMAGEAARELLESHGVVVGVVRNYDQVVAADDVRLGGLFQPVDNGLGKAVPVPSAPCRWRDAPEPTASAVPRLGQHSVQVLRELGYDEARIRALCAEGAVGGETEPPARVA
ncbi:CoA transferase [Verticiella sediminum]|uniref:CoA transferase n=1 Tax=Verticiella sediminum TaxID=1247510 RepID=A0A556ALV8_9BURK|nr:CoA transferase [Verticiella sediminum]TSH93851.1 CoA transferase [Verticiella sediminum]